MSKDKKILTTKEVAEYLNIHPLTVNRYAREGRIPAFKIGTDWRFHKKYLEKFIKQNLIHSRRSNRTLKDAEDRPLPSLRSGLSKDTETKSKCSINPETNPGLQNEESRRVDL